ncbi:MAG: FAD-dependent thymidylate synthase [Magnetovibrionaceae bacterium]
MSMNEDQKAEIAELREETRPTLRVTAPALEEVLYEPMPVLDHGFVRVIDYMGDDAAIVQAARVSYGKGTKSVRGDEGLIRYLMRHRHTTPFEMCEIKYHIKLPIFVARQWIRHRTANVNEYSARYSVLDREYYLPAPDQVAYQSKANHQGRSAPMDEETSAEVIRLLHEDSDRCYSTYEDFLNMRAEGQEADEEPLGLARELARMNLTLNTYTQWYWKVDLHNLLHFLSLRADSHAQYEIRVYADAMLETVRRWVPFAYQAFMDYRVGGAHLSAKGLDVVKALLDGKTVEQAESGLSLREWRELMAQLGRD